MNKFVILTEAINYIECNLCEPITRAEIAGHCYVSLSMLEKLFNYALRMSIKLYIERRRMTAAAFDIAKAGMSVTDTAMKYQYNSVEVFSRAFKRIWNINPSEFNGKWRFTGIFPKINYQYNKGEELHMARKRVDISEAYDYMKSKSGSYVLCFDTQHLTLMNNISRKLGDLVILETASRIDSAADDDMLMLRIGGDEFVLLTGTYEIEKAEAVMQAVLSKNGNAIEYEGKQYPCSLWCGITTIPEHLRYSDFFTDIHNTIDNSKK